MDILQLIGSNKRHEIYCEILKDIESILRDCKSALTYRYNKA